MVDGQMDTTPPAGDIETEVKSEGMSKVPATTKKKSPKRKAVRGSGSDKE
jgi:hypothetical protein